MILLNQKIDFSNEMHAAIGFYRLKTNVLFVTDILIPKLPMSVA